MSEGSHEIVERRELSISDESETKIQQRLRVTDFPHVIEPFEAGKLAFIRVGYFIGQGRTLRSIHE